MSIEAMKDMIKWDRPCYKCLSHYCDLSCKETLKQGQEPYGYLKLSNGKFYVEVVGVPDLDCNPDYLPLHTHPQPKQEQGEPVAFKIYLPKVPRQDVNHGLLPWVYDQDPSSGNVASMWVTPVQTLRSKT